MTYTEEDVQGMLEKAIRHLKLQAPASTATATKSTEEKSKEETFQFDVNKIPEFKFDPDSANTFARWFERYQPLIEDESGKLRTAENRARFIAAKLGRDEYNQFADKLSPNRIMDLEYKDLIEELTQFFDQPTTLFRRRLRLFETAIGSSTVRELKGRIKTQTTLSELESFTTDDLQCFIAINALKGQEHKISRMRALNFLEAHSDTTVDELLDDLERFQSIQRDASEQQDRRRGTIFKVEPTHGKQVRAIEQSPATDVAAETMTS